MLIFWLNVVLCNQSWWKMWVIRYAQHIYPAINVVGSNYSMSVSLEEDASIFNLLNLNLFTLI